jgi:TPR repeat protein
MLAAEQGHVQAAYALGLAFRQGDGIQADLCQAVSWFEKAAVAGHAKAQWNLGGIYISGGEGVPQDLKRAFQYCQQSAEQGFAPGQASLGLRQNLPRHADLVGDVEPMKRAFALEGRKALRRVPGEGATQHAPATAQAHGRQIIAGSC